MNQSINTDSKNSKEPQQKYRLGTVSIKILGGLNRFYRRLTSPSASIMVKVLFKDLLEGVHLWLQLTNRLSKTKYGVFMSCVISLFQKDGIEPGSPDWKSDTLTALP